MKRPVIETLEFKGGFAVVTEGELYALLSAYKANRVRKDHFRVWAARLESGSLHQKSLVTEERILNCKSDLPGIKHLRSGEKRKAAAELDSVLRGAENGRKRIISRVVLRSIAQGRLSCTEVIVCIMYSARRITQRKALKRLFESERYARFSFRELEEFSGVSKANLSRTVRRLKVKGLLSTVWVVKQNENQFGLLFVDGPLLSLIPGASLARNAPQKSTTPSTRKSNAPLLNLTTLKKEDPKNEIRKGESQIWTGGKTWRDDWERILARSEAMKANQVDQAA